MDADMGRKMPHVNNDLYDPHFGGFVVGRELYSPEERGRGLSVRRRRGKRELHVNRRDSNFVRPHIVRGTHA